MKKTIFALALLAASGTVSACDQIDLRVVKVLLEPVRVVIKITKGLADPLAIKHRTKAVNMLVAIDAIYPSCFAMVTGDNI